MTLLWGCAQRRRTAPGGADNRLGIGSHLLVCDGRLAQPHARRGNDVRDVDQPGRQPVPGIGLDRVVPMTFARLDTHEVRVEVGHLERSEGAVESIEQIRPPHRLIDHNLLGSRLGTAARLGDQQAKLDACAVLQVTVREVDLEPVPYENGNLVEDEGVLHALLLSHGRIPGRWYLPTAPAGWWPATR
jgi:hypothetical protein